jgi:chromosome condensin MukBEF MukE localization factor
MKKKLKTYIVPVVHVVEFGCEVRVEAKNREHAERLARDPAAEVVEEGYDWNRSATVRARRGYWDRIRLEK